MDLKSFEGLRNYAVRMRKRGDSWGEIKKFLKSNWHNDAQVTEILEQVKEMEKNREFLKEPQRKEFSLRNIIIGGTVFSLGFFLFLTIGYRGFISGVPLIMMGAGLFGMFQRN